MHQIGRLFDLKHDQGLLGEIVGALSSNNEDVAAAASYCLGMPDDLFRRHHRHCLISGCLGVGNLSFYLPFILQQLEQDEGRHYLTLSALKVFFVSVSLHLDEDIPNCRT